MRYAVRMVLTAMLVMGLGCGSFTDPRPIVDEFAWEAVENPNNVQEGVDAAAFLGDISFLGQFRTPTLCFSLKQNIEKSGSTVTLRIDATSSGSTTCAQTPGGFRYTGVIRNLESGTYTLRVIHAVTGMPPQEYTKTVSP